MCHNILCYGNCIIEVDDSMPPSAGDKYSLSWVLDELDHMKIFLAVMTADLWEDLCEVVYGLLLIVGWTIGFAFYDGFGDLFSEQNPTFVPY